MVNTYAKGKRFERKVANYLKLKGWIKDFYIAPRLRWSKTQDIFNQFDILAHNGSSLWLIQCTSNRGMSHTKRRKIQSWVDKVGSGLLVENNCRLFVAYQHENTINFWEIIDEIRYTSADFGERSV